MRKWLLPEHVEDILPPEAERIEALRSRLLEVFRVHGYELVAPPLLEYIDSLLTGTGSDLDLRTFKLVDQLSGRTMGLRADITPQVARIDAHLLNRKGVARLCYCGPVLHTRPRNLNATREPLQLGAELYGHGGIEGDLEMQRLVRRTLAAAGIDNARLDLGHVGVFRALAQRAGLTGEHELELLEALQQKDRAGIEALTRSVPEPARSALAELTSLYGGADVIARARGVLPRDPQIDHALRALEELSSDSDDAVSIDLGDLRGYHYHSGVVFAAYSAGVSGAIALGGRYDEVGKAFGRARPATGFTVDLRELARVSAQVNKPRGILAPIRGEHALEARVAALRTAGEIVVYDLPGHDTTLDELNCDRRLVLRDGAWTVEPLH